MKVHDFLDVELGKAIPYGVYDISENQGWVSVGTDHDTARFAAEAIARWWKKMGSKRYGDAKELLITADGGQLIVSPNFNPAVVREAVRLGLLCLPGVMTPSEAFAALEAGASGLKLFPAEMIGPAVLRSLRAVLPQSARLLPVGGITPDNMGSYLAAGANGFGIGSALYQPGMEVNQVQANAKRFMAACQVPPAAP